MALDLTQPNYFGGAVNAFDMGRQMGKQLAVKNALDMYGDDPSGAQSALIKAGALDEASQLAQVRSQQQNLKAIQAAGDAAKGGDYTSAAQAAASNGDPGLAGQYAAIPQQIQASNAPKTQAVVAFAGQMQQAVPSDPNDVEGTIARRKAYLQQNAPALHQVGITDQDIQALVNHGDADFTDAGIDSLRAAATAQGNYKPPYMTVPYGSTVINTSNGQTVMAGHKFHATTLKREDGTTFPAVIDEATGAGFGVGMDGQPVMSQPLNMSQYKDTGAAPTGAQASPTDTATSQPPSSLSVRNNNPGNLRADGSKWQGMTGVDQNGFVQFDTAANGERAARVNLANQQTLHGINTISDLVTKYAPAGDNNNTRSYIQSVAQQTGFSPTQPLDFHDKATQDKVLAAMFNVEGGGTPTKAPAVPAGGQAVSGQSGASSASGGRQTLADVSQPVMSAADKALVASRADAMALGEQFNSRNPRDQYLTRLASEMALDKYGPDALNPANAASLEANKKELDKLSSQRDTVYTSEDTVNRNLGILENLAPKGLASGTPVFNKWIQAGRVGLAGDSDVTALNAAMNTVVSEYAKVMSGSTGGQGTSDSARHEAQTLLNGSMTLDQLNKNIGVLKQEMDNRVGSMDETIANRVKAIRTGGGPGNAPGQIPPLGQSSQGAPAGGSSPPQGAQSGQSDQSVAAIAQRTGHTPAQVIVIQQMSAKPLTGAPGSATRPYVPRTQQDYNWLKPGMHYVDTDGAVKVKS